jgi:hypothetical protein
VGWLLKGHQVRKIGSDDPSVLDLDAAIGRAVDDLTRDMDAWLASAPTRVEADRNSANPELDAALAGMGEIASALQSAGAKIRNYRNSQSDASPVPRPANHSRS